MPKLQVSIKSKDRGYRFVFDTAELQWERLTIETVSKLQRGFEQLLNERVATGESLLYARFEPDGRLDFCNLDFIVTFPAVISASRISNGAVILLKEAGGTTQLAYTGARFCIHSTGVIIIEKHGEYEGTPLTDYEIFTIV